MHWLEKTIYLKFNILLNMHELEYLFHLSEGTVK
jgi:hypothetical protein